MMSVVGKQRLGRLLLAALRQLLCTVRQRIKQNEIIKASDCDGR